MLKAIKRTAFVAALATLSTPVLAASDGTLGADSTGTSVISVTLNDVILITGMNDIAFGVYTGTGNLDNTATPETFCVYRNGSGAYRATLTGNWDAAGAAGTDFYLKNTASTDVVPYTVSYSGNAATTGTPITPLAGDSADPTCAGTGGSNANVVVTILHADLQGAPTGDYNGTLTIFVEPI